MFYVFVYIDILTEIVLYATCGITPCKQLYILIIIHTVYLNAPKISYMVLHEQFVPKKYVCQSQQNVHLVHPNTMLFLMNPSFFRSVCLIAETLQACQCSAFLGFPCGWKAKKYATSQLKYRIAVCTICSCLIDGVSFFFRFTG